MSAEKILAELKKKIYKPVYLLEGEEEYYIDKVVQYAENEILSEAEAGFNLTVFYGKDAEWTEVVNACRRYPMFSERQVVILKEAQAMRNIEKLEVYVDKPLSSTLLFIAYKGKKLDGRTKLGKYLKEKGVVLTTKKLYENELPDFTQQLAASKGFTLTSKALFLLIDHIGNDLSRLNNEIDKLALNLADRKNITEDDIERYVGISKEFNVFELQQAMGARDLYKAMRIVQYFGSNPKAGPLQLIFPSLYTYFSKVLMTFGVPARDEKSIAQAIGVHPFFMKDYLQAAQRYGPQGVERNLLLLHQYNLKSLGINDAGTDDHLLLKEMVVKMMSGI
ncbi:DNA polymerase III subunit delta [Paraflavisolibacter sp. H34]|uniref:DNA polymerase III subunit delta n=1 Tax=Huijunlia imazamoxiresistens TaxID=3127457 RepID=UPI003019791F